MDELKLERLSDNPNFQMSLGATIGADYQYEADQQVVDKLRAQHKQEIAGMIKWLDEAHWALLGISNLITNHSYSRSITKGDSDFIQNIGKQTMSWSNSAFQLKAKYKE